MLLTVEKLIYGGDGLARTPPDGSGRSMAVLVPFALPGERVEVELHQEKPGFARGRVMQLLQPSPARIPARCPYFQQCGGCHYQHIPHERQLEFKEAILRETLQRIAKVELASNLRVHSAEPWNYRNRTRLQVRTSPEFALAYYRFASHDLLPVRECPISSPLINRLIGRLTELRGCSCPEAVQEIEFFSDAEDQKLLAWAFCKREAEEKTLLGWSENVRREFPEVSGITFFSSRRRSEDESPADPQRTGYSGSQEIAYRTQAANFRVSAGAFFQVNRYLVEDLITTVTAGATGDLALDLYAGVGLFSASLARNFRHIFAVEASQISHTDLRQNIPANVKAVRARTEDYLKSMPVRKRPDLIVLDPPRTGLGKAVGRSLASLAAPRLRYVSCDPATLARDLAPLLAAGYRIEEAHLFDLFPQTFHIESVFFLAR